MDYEEQNGLIWIPRGEVAAYDLSDTDFTADSQWTTMVVPSVVPLNAKRVQFLFIHKSNTLGTYWQWREKGVTSDFNRFTSQIRVPAVSEQHYLNFALNAATEIDYKLQAISWIDLDFVVTAWAI